MGELKYISLWSKKKTTVFFLCFIYCGLVGAEDRIYGLPIKTVSDYSLLCEKWGDKTEPDKRGSTCLAFLQGVKVGLSAAAGKSKECAQQIDSISPMLMHDFFISMKNETIDMRTFFFDVLEVSAPKCKKYLR
jgi:hypothetical protein